MNTSTDRKDKKPMRVTIDGRYWDRSDLERFHLQQYIAKQEEEGKPPVIKFILRDGKAVSGRFVELGTFCYAIDAKVGDTVRRVIIAKHAIDYVILGEGESA